MTQSPTKFERPEIAVTDTEEEGLCPPYQGPSTRSISKKRNTTMTPKLDIELSTLLKFIKPYDGSREKLNSFLVNCNNAYELASDSQKDILFKYILCQLEGKAETACSIKEFTNWTQLKDFLKTQFSERKHYAHLLTDLQECKQQPNENVSQYALRIETCLSQLLTEISISHGHKSREMIGRTAAMEELALHHFQMGLLPRISNIVRCKSARTLNDAINCAISEEKIQQSLYRHNPGSSSHNSQQPRFDKLNASKQNNQFARRNPSNSNQLQQRSNFHSNRPNSNNSTTLFCRYCKTPGHTLEQCRKREYNNNRFKNYDQSQTRAAQRINFVSDDSPETNYDDHPINSTDGYDTVDCDSKNE